MKPTHKPAPTTPIRTQNAVVSIGWTLAASTGLALVAWGWAALQPTKTATTTTTTTTTTCAIPLEFSSQSKDGAQWQEDWRLLEEHQGKLGNTLPKTLVFPLPKQYKAGVRRTWGMAVLGKAHRGQDFIAPVGTPVVAVAAGYVWRMRFSPIGGLELTIVGNGGQRYYYAHLAAYADGLANGQYVAAGAALGEVGNTGQAHGTPHLHLGVYRGSRHTCDFTALDPWPLLGLVDGRSPPQAN
jgi:peptidoglycan LD-endopeptidase LytH